MASILRCPEPECRGTLWSVNDGASRLLAYSGRLKVQCDKCRTCFALDASRIVRAGK